MCARRHARHIQPLTALWSAMLMIFLCSLNPCLCLADAAPGEPASTAEPLTQSQVERLTLDSAYMKFNVPFMVYLPKGYDRAEKAYPVWYGLHGYSSSETFWLNTAGIGAEVDRLMASGAIAPMIMVFPLTRYDPAKAIQEDMLDGKRDASQMERFLCEELIPYVDTHYNTAPSPESRYIGGFSMGGMFALQIALHRPDLFSKVGGYSPALTYRDFSGGRFDKWLNDCQDANPAFPLTDYAKNKGLSKLRVYLDYGTVNDPFSDGVQALYAALLVRGVDVTLHPHGGGHSLQRDKLEAYLLFYDGAESLKSHKK